MSKIINNQNLAANEIFEFGIDAENLANQMYRIREKAVFNNSQILKNELSDFLSNLKRWKPRYDFDLWDKVEDYFYQIWPKLKGDIRLAIEYNLYSEVKSLFFELRNLLQWSGEIESRIYFASWLKKEAMKRGDIGTVCIAISSLTWSFTSSGNYRDLKKANYYLSQLEEILLSKSDYEKDRELHACLRESLGCDGLYSELMMDAHENLVRVQIRNRDLEKAKTGIDKGVLVVQKLFDDELISPRLRERFLIAFDYHVGIISCVSCDYKTAESVFKDIENRAQHIGWNRVVKGAESWLAKIALELSNYDDCNEILVALLNNSLSSSHYNKRDGICYLLKAQLFHRQGFQEEEIASEREANRVLKKIMGSEKISRTIKEDSRYSEFLINNSCISSTSVPSERCNLEQGSVNI